MFLSNFLILLIDHFLHSSLAFSLEVQSLHDMLIKPFLIVNFQVTCWFCPQKTCIFKFVQNVFFETEKSFLRISPGNDLLPNFLLILHIQIFLSFSSLSLLIFSFMFGFQSLGHHQLSISFLLIHIQILAPFLFFLFFLKLIDGSHN